MRVDSRQVAVIHSRRILISLVTEWAMESTVLSAPPPGLSNVVTVAGGRHSLALLGDGRVVGWRGPPTPDGLTNAVAISAGTRHSLALTDEGRVVEWGANFARQISVPAGLSNVVQVAAGANASLRGVSPGIWELTGKAGRVEGAWTMAMARKVRIAFPGRCTT